MEPTIIVHQINLNEDEYSFLIQTPDPQINIIVDPGDSKIIIEYLEANFQDISITHIFLTHKHQTHIQGLKPLLNYLQDSYTKKQVEYNFKVYAGFMDYEIEKDIMNVVESDTSINVQKDLNVRVLKVPCHTKDHLIYYIEHPERHERVIFTGDTLFIGGCGKFFEGNAEDMLLNFQKILSLPEHTFIYCGHDYTIQNLTWALSIEWENEEIYKKLEWAKNQKLHGKSTLPSTIGEEKKYNIFMRCTTDRILQKFHTENPVEALAELRLLKDNNTGLRKLSTQ